MQPVVDVASQSPPVVTPATTPAEKSQPSPGQDPFDLVLQKASERADPPMREDSLHCKSVKQPNDRAAVNNAGSTKAAKPIKESEDVEAEKNTQLKSVIEDEDGVNENAAPFVQVIVAQQELVTQSVEPVAEENNENTTIPVVTNISNAESMPEETRIETETNKIGRVLADEVSSEKVAEMDEKASTTFKQVIPSKPQDSKQISTRNDVSYKQEPVDAPDMKVDEVKPDSVGSQPSIKVHHSSGQAVKPNESAQDTQGLTAASIEVEKEVGEISKTDPPEQQVKVESVPINSTAKTILNQEPARLADAPKTVVITQVTDQIGQMIKNNQSSIRVQLYPEELGHIDLKIISNRNGVGVTMIADKASTQQVLRSEADTLKQTIEQAGIQINNLNINQGSSSNRQNLFEERNYHPQAENESERKLPGATNSSEKLIRLGSSTVDYKV